MKKPFSLTFILLVTAIMYLPILLMVVFSFSNTAIRGDFDFSFDLYIKLFSNENIMTAVWNTLLIAVVASAAATLIATMAATGILSMSKRGKALTMSLNQLPIVNADIVTSLSLFLLFTAIGIANSGYFTLILAHTLIALPFCLLTIMPRIRQLDPNLIDAALDLGATPGHAFLTVVVPQLIPAMLNAFLLGFTLSLDDFVITQYNNGSSGVSTISTEVYGSLGRGLIPNEYRALTTIIFAVIFISLLIYNLNSRRYKKNGY